MSTDEAQRIVADHAWELGWPDADDGPDGLPVVAAQACGRLSESQHQWRSRYWVLAEAMAEADACADGTDDPDGHPVVDAIRTLVRHHLDTARPRRGSCTDDEAAHLLELLGWETAQ